MKFKKVNKAPERWMLAGIKEHEACVKAIRQAKEHAIDAGDFFMRARAALPPEDSFTFFLNYWAKAIPERTVQRYMEFTLEVMAWAEAENPKLADQPEKLLALGKKMVLQSPKGLVALCRQLGEMRKFGEYDEVKYALQKRKNSAPLQIEFEFAAALTTVDLLAQLDGQRVTFKVPEGQTEADALLELEGKLQAALKCVAARRADVAAEEVETHPTPDTATIPLALPPAKKHPQK